MNQPQMTEKIFGLIARAWAADAPHMMPKEDVLRMQAAAWAQELTEIEFTDMDSQEFDWLFGRCRKLAVRRSGGNPIPSLALFQSERYSNDVREHLAKMRNAAPQKAVAIEQKQSGTALALAMIEDDLSGFVTAFELGRLVPAEVRAVGFGKGVREFLASGGERKLVNEMLERHGIKEDAKAFLFEKGAEK